MSNSICNSFATHLQLQDVPRKTFGYCWNVPWQDCRVVAWRSSRIAFHRCERKIMHSLRLYIKMHWGINIAPLHPSQCHTGSLQLGTKEQCVWTQSCTLGSLYRQFVDTYHPCGVFLSPAKDCCSLWRQSWLQRHVRNAARPLKTTSWCQNHSNHINFISFWHHANVDSYMNSFTSLIVYYKSDLKSNIFVSEHSRTHYRSELLLNDVALK